MNMRIESVNVSRPLEFEFEGKRLSAFKERTQ